MKDFTMAIIAGLIMFYGSTPYADVYEVVAPVYVDDELYDIDTSKPVQIKLVEHTTRFSMQDAYGEGFDDAMAFQMWNGEVCEVHVMQMKGWNDVQVQSDLGHEILHCYGTNHNDLT